MTRTTVNEAVCEALFASPLQPSETLTAEAVAHAIGRTVRNLGAVGCTSRTVEAFRNHPQEAADRMRWIRQLTRDVCGRLYLPTALPTTTTSAGTGLLPVREAA